MPEKPPIASDDEINDFLKSRTPTAAPAAGSAPAASAAPDRGPQGILGPGLSNEIQRGIGKEASSLAINTGRLANKGIGLVSPTARSELSELAHKVPGFNRLERFADEPYQGMGERIGGIGTDLATFAFSPEIKVASSLMKGADLISPTSQIVRMGAKGKPLVRMRGGQMVAVPTKWGKVAQGVADTAEAGTKGAIGGAISDPDDPGRGAEIGAAGGLVAPGASRYLRSGAGQHTATAIGRYGPTAAAMTALHHMGVPWPFTFGIHALLYHNRIGPRFARWMFDTAGRALGLVDPISGGVLAGEGARAMSGGYQLPSLPGSKPPPSSWDIEDQDPENAPPEVGPPSRQAPPSS